MKVHECLQHSEEWDALRLGIPTSSEFKSILTPTKLQRSTSRESYLYTLAAQRISGRSDPTFTSTAMEEGIRREEESRRVYAMNHEVAVRRVGFCTEDGGRWGCSPDGLVGDDGMVELKNPLGKTMIGYLLKQAIPTEYHFQIQSQLFVTGREWCDFAPYYPGLPEVCLRVEPDRVIHKALASALVEFCNELDSICAKIKGGS